MSRHSAATDAALNGIAGLVLLTIGSVAASILGYVLGPWLAAIPALIVWGFFAFYGLRQFAYGLHTVVEDATRK